MTVSHDAAQCRTHVRRVPRQQAYEPQRSQVAPLADQESEVLAAGPGHATAEQAAAGLVGNQIVRVIEQRRIDPRLSEHLGWVCTRLLRSAGIVRMVPMRTVAVPRRVSTFRFPDPCRSRVCTTRLRRRLSEAVRKCPVNVHKCPAQELPYDLLSDGADACAAGVVHFQFTLRNARRLRT